MVSLELAERSKLTAACISPTKRHLWHLIGQSLLPWLKTAESTGIFSLSSYPGEGKGEGPEAPRVEAVSRAGRKLGLLGEEVWVHGGSLESWLC